MGKIRIFKNLLFILLFLCSALTQAKELTKIRVGVLVSFYSEMPFLSEAHEYKQAYTQAIRTASYAAKKNGLNFQYKLFMYGNGPIDILEIIPSLKKWNPDLIIGPNASDKFLLLKNSIEDTLVISSYASAVTLEGMPKNFYSTFLPDKKIMQVLSDYIDKRFPKKNIYLIEQIDCKQCMDAAKVFIQSYKKINLHTTISARKIFLDDVALINAESLLKHHENDVILIFNSTYYTYNQLIKHLSKFSKKKHLIFFSDQENWNNEINGKKYNFDLAYESYRIGPVLFNKDVFYFKNFSEAYMAVYHKKPKTALSYMTYISLMSVIEALNKYPCARKNVMKEKVLCSYMLALKNNADWFRQSKFGIYRLTSKGEVLVEEIPINTIR